MEDEEVNVYTMQGSTKNPTFVAGRTFTINTDKTADHGTSVGMPQNQRFLLTQVSIAAFENTYGRHLVSDLQYILSSPVRWISSLFRDDARDQGAYIDPMSAMASGYLTQQLDATLMQGLVQSYFSGLQGTVVRHMDKYANAFIAVPYDQDHWGQIPSPDGTKPRAYGPHLAVVIGSSGTDISKSEVFADALGRVRVRFPWQTTGPKQAIESVDELLESDKCTAWVPVCEEWAGRGFGTQFLPRIGQQVLVHFLDGDPERPIITGRVYSTKGANTNLPFMPAASKILQTIGPAGHQEGEPAAERHSHPQHAAAGRQIRQCHRQAAIPPAQVRRHYQPGAVPDSLPGTDGTSPPSATISTRPAAIGI